MSSKRWSSYYLLAGLITTAIVLLSIFLVWKQRQEGRIMAEVSVTNTASVLASQVEYSFDQTNALLVDVGQRYADAKRRGTTEIGRVFDEVRREVQNYPLVSRVDIVDDHGTNFLTTGLYAQTDQHLDLSNRDYFKRAHAGVKGLIFSDPLLSSLTKEWSIILARRIETDNGEFIGVVLAVVPVQTIGKTFETSSWETRA